MSPATAGAICRLTIRGPAQQVDLAVPVDVVIADLMPVLLSHLGSELADNGLGHGGWVLQRLGGAALDEDRTIDGLGLRDGDVVYLRGRADQLPPADFDDLIDGLATAVRGRAGLWRSHTTRWAAASLLVLILAVGVVVVTLAGPPDLRAAAAIVAALACFIAAVAVGQRAELRPVGVVLAAGATGYAGVAGLIAPTPPTQRTGVVWATPQVFTASVAVLAVVVVGIATLAWARPLFVGILTGGVVSAAAGALGTFLGLPMVKVAGVVVVLATVCATVVPLLAFRLTGLRLAPLPTAPEHLQEDLDPVSGQHVMDRAVGVDRHMTALYAGLALPNATGLVLLGSAPGWAPPTLAALAAVVLTLSARPMTSAWHRLCQLTAAASGLVAIVIRLAVNDERARLIVPAAGVPLGVLACVLLARFAPGRRMMPYWGRVGDALHIVAAVAMLPVLFALLDVYGRARAIGG